MKAHLILGWVWILLAGWCSSCGNEEHPLPDPDPLANTTLDELQDKKEYGEGMVVDSRYYQNQRVLKVLLNGQELQHPSSLDLREAGYYHLDLFATLNGSSPLKSIRLVVLDPERGTTEWGLAPWNPQGAEISAPEDLEIHLIHPRAFPADLALPLIVKVDKSDGSQAGNYQAQVSEASFLVKRGMGSSWLSPASGTVQKLSMGPYEVDIHWDIMAQDPIYLQGILANDLHVPAGSHVVITKDLIVPAGLAFTVEAGAVIQLAPAVNIYNRGSIAFNGSSLDPVYVGCTEEENLWGGIIGDRPQHTIHAEHTVFSRSGYHLGAGYDWGHAHRQALMYSKEGEVKLRNCYLIDHAGQMLFLDHASLEMDQCLLQRAITGGQLNYSQVHIKNSVFTDFPDEQLRYQDQDNDALYLVECQATIEHSAFMYAADDGVDSGSGGESGEVHFKSCTFESVFHEGAALSGGSAKGKTHYFSQCTFRDCGQGLELGFSHEAHHVFVDSCIFEANGIGIRYGDNYDWGNNGTLWVSNSRSTGNYFHDVWNMDREDWVADTSSMVFEQVCVSKENSMYPNLKLCE